MNPTLLAALLAVTTPGVLHQDLGVPDVIDTTVCAIAQNPERYDARIVRVRANVVRSFETADLKDVIDGCPSVSFTYPESASQKAPTTPRPEVELVEDDEYDRFRQFMDAVVYPRNRGTVCIACYRYQVTAVFTGRIDVAQPIVADGIPRQVAEIMAGFGHMGYSKVRMVVTRVAEVSAREGGYDTTAFSTEPIRFPAGNLTGTVRRASGHPVGGLTVYAIDPESDTSVNLETTDENGTFAISVPPGEYIVGINVFDVPSAEFPFATTYAPGTTERKAARRLRIADFQNLDASIYLSLELPEREIPVFVRTADGQPVEGALIQLTSPKNPAFSWSDESKTDSSGFALITGFRGFEYFAKARRETGVQTCVTREVPAAIAPGNPLVMILPETRQSC